MIACEQNLMKKEKCTRKIAAWELEASKENSCAFSIAHVRA